MQRIINQAIKFIIVGITNTLIDFAVLNFLIFLSGISSGLGYSIFKGTSFTVAVINSYFLNKFWTFKDRGKEKTQKEFVQFIVVSLAGLGINVGVASLVVNVISRRVGIVGEIWSAIGGQNIFTTEVLWANMGVAVATLVAMTWNFLGYKFIVFKDKNAESGSISKIQA